MENKWVKIGGAIVIAILVLVMVVFKDDVPGSKPAQSGDHPPATSYSDDPSLKGLKIPSSN